MVKAWILGLITEAVKELIESGKVAAWLDLLREEVIKWLEPTLRALAAKTETALDDKVVDIILSALRK